MKSSPWHLFVLFASCTTHIAEATTIATFTDHKCQHPLKQLKGQNGYPSGNCTELGEAGDYGSFKVIEEDAGSKTAPSSNDNKHVGAIAGGVVGGVVGTALVLGMLWFLWRRRHPRRKGRRAELPDSESRHALGLRVSELEAPKAIYEVPITESSPSELPESKALPSELPET
ncbi:hypothetical protein N7510_003317 [Penicillium lagena]|uniref:uncharacterized protein n=1 Tax=Penicillium lagena TaxID=94218 RepID=UPI0025416C50|nr:uncharacterized protein N7510_003317 [Penicillium lagena]KAJ5619333.1 hypothetical protein N7510_003317 [Penicillium lagena]